MAVTLKPLNQQTIVITGASSGIGLVTARAAAKQGARVVLAARNDEALTQLESEINSSGGQALHIAADVASLDDLRRVAHQASARFGGIDTWVNNAGVSVYGRIDQIALDDHRRLFDTNFWGVVHGSLVALEQMRQRGGALINMGSAVSDRAVPLQGMYAASKHAVKGFTDSLRMELEEEGAPVSVTLIKPAAIDTPFTQNAKNYMENEPDFPPPVYAPETVAQAILHAATHRVRDIHVGGASKMFQVMDKYAPRATDRYMEKTMFDQQKSDEPRRPGRRDALRLPGEGLRERGGYEGHVAESSLYTQAKTHPVISTLFAAGAGLALAAVLAPKPKRRRAYFWND